MFRLKAVRSRFGRSRRSGPSPKSALTPLTNSRAIRKSDDIFDRLDAYWYGGRTGFIPPEPQCATEEEIEAFEQTHTVRLPADLRAYFLRFNGVEHDPDLFCFWPINKLAPAEAPALNLLERGRYFLFADYLIESSYYAIYLGDDPYLQNRVILPDFPNKPVIASNFSDFLELYLRDDPKLYGNA